MDIKGIKSARKLEKNNLASRTRVAKIFNADFGEYRTVFSLEGIPRVSRCVKSWGS